MNTAWPASSNLIGHMCSRLATKYPPPSVWTAIHLHAICKLETNHGIAVSFFDTALCFRERRDHISKGIHH